MSRFRVHFLTRFNFEIPIGTNLWIRIRTVFQFAFHYRLGSGFEPLSILLPHFGYGSGFKPFTHFPFHCVLGSGFEPLSELLFFNMRYGSGFEPLSIFFSFHHIFWIRIRTAFQTAISIKSLFCYHIKPAHTLNHMY